MAEVTCKISGTPRGFYLSFKRLFKTALRAEKIPQALNKMPNAPNYIGRTLNKRVAASKKPPLAPNPVSHALAHSPKIF
ncbi:hypothetical protein HNR44_002106 [Geomicrobium halophilum]|uniref:Uncharacterized protein n=1 Tax=Geomicrobium halophilum TaxID=549000 RepID=A0A841Q1Z3_9BACL|nr:hypothetical protein [Geomicrobium halophilum]MBB6450128.1 hypothetical protein [Geomicrobium halophilum]